MSHILKERIKLILYQNPFSTEGNQPSSIARLMSRTMVGVVVMGSLSTLPLSAAEQTTITNASALQQFAQEKQAEWERDRAEVETFAAQNDIPVREEFDNCIRDEEPNNCIDTIIEIQRIENGLPIFYTTNNANAAKTTRTDRLWIAPFNVTGNGYNKLSEWDGGGVRTTHQELTGRVTQIDTPASFSAHATHVAGTLIASGVKAAAKGMAYQATLKAYDWNNDVSEMTTAAGNGMEISNHSYGTLAGWAQLKGWKPSWQWFGDPTVNLNESDYFGFYNSDAQEWDKIAHDAPFYLIVKAAMNNRNDDRPANGTPFQVNGVGTIYEAGTDPTPGPDFQRFNKKGYDTIPFIGTAKNILTVGAVEDVDVDPKNYKGHKSIKMSTFSGWGPTDDGRIKPDIVGHGVKVLSSTAQNDKSYGQGSGTSMASPNVAGTLALLQQHYQNLHAGPMRSATLKALAIHTADEAGKKEGPDYQFGWGLLNGKSAAQLITDDNNAGGSQYIKEETLDENETWEHSVIVPACATELRATIVWTDPAGTPVKPAVLNPTNRMLVNDLDLRITDPNGQDHFPWVLDPAKPNKAATTADNDRDNVEQVLIKSKSKPTAPGEYTVRVTHKGTLINSPQAFSLIVTSRGGICAVNDQGLNNSQFLAIDVFTEPPVIVPIGDVHQGYDIEALDLSCNNELYAASGDDTDKPGHLYKVDKVLGTLEDIGAIGDTTDLGLFEEIDTISFNPGSQKLWGWAQDDGLFEVISFDPLKINLVWPHAHRPEELEAITWIDDTTLCGVYNLHNQAGNPDNHEDLDRHGPPDYEDGMMFVCTDIAYIDPDTMTGPYSTSLTKCQIKEPRGEIEALEALPNKKLLLSIHGNDSLILGVFTPPTGLSIPTTPPQPNCEEVVVVEAEFPTQSYNDIEGIAVPHRCP